MSELDPAFVALTFLTKGPSALGAGMLSGWLRTHPRFLAGLHRLSGTMLIGLGVKLVLQRRA